MLKTIHESTMKVGDSCQIGASAKLALLVLKKTILKRVSFLFWCFFSKIGLKCSIKAIQIIIPPLNPLTLLVMKSSVDKLFLLVAQ